MSVYRCKLWISLCGSRQISDTSESVLFFSCTFLYSGICTVQQGLKEEFCDLRSHLARSTNKQFFFLKGICLNLLFSTSGFFAKPSVSDSHYCHLQSSSSDWCAVSNSSLLSSLRLTLMRNSNGPHVCLCQNRSVGWGLARALGFKPFHFSCIWLHLKWSPVNHHNFSFPSDWISDIIQGTNLISSVILPFLFSGR